MASITVNTVLSSDALGIPELLPMAGKRVEIRVTEDTDSALDQMFDADVQALFDAEDWADTSPVMSIEEIQAMLRCIPGSMAEEVIADREER